MSHSETHYSRPSSLTSNGARGRGYLRSRRKIGTRGRARGCRGLPPPSQYQEQLTPDGEQSEQFDEAEAAELEARYARRTIGTNADRYEEPEPEIGLDGQPIPETEVDLSAFLERQRMEDPPGVPLVSATADDDQVDHSLAHITSNPLADRQSRKGKIQHVDWDASLEKMQHDNNIARAQSDLKERLRASGTYQKGKTATREHARQVKPLKEAPPLPQDPHLAAKSPKAEMEDFLNDLLA